jgi:bifunctional non-homologous end joining protein LigD
MSGTAENVHVDGRELRLTNLHKVLYPATGTTKGEVVQYYSSIATVMLPHLAGRCITLKRFPDGVQSDGFFEKRCPKHRPPWMETAVGPGDRNGEVPYCRLEEQAALVWTANMAAIELHVPMALSADLESPRAVVFDFDPGAPAAVRETCTTALLVREVLDSVGLLGFCKTSGSKGLQMYVPLNTPCTHQLAGEFALAVGQVLERQHRDSVTTEMARVERPGKVFVDWSQNSRHKTTIGVYSMRARPEPTCSTPVTWDEVQACADGDVELKFDFRQVLERVEQHGDLFADVLTLQQSLPSPR